MVGCVSASDGAGPRKVLADAVAGSVVSSLFCVCDLQISVAVVIVKIGVGGESLSVCGQNGSTIMCLCFLVY